MKHASRADQLCYDGAGQLTVKLKVPAQNGRANACLVEFLARQLGIPKSNVTITAGFTSQFKRVDVDMEDESAQRIIWQNRQYVAKPIYWGSYIVLIRAVLTP